MTTSACLSVFDIDLIYAMVYIKGCCYFRGKGNGTGNGIVRKINKTKRNGFHICADLLAGLR